MNQRRNQNKYAYLWVVATTFVKEKDTNGEKHHKCCQTRYAVFNQINFPESLFYSNDPPPNGVTFLILLNLVFYCLVLLLKII